MVVEKDATCANIPPLDIKRIILLKLPAKSLLRFKTVCKSWNALISDDDFSRSHLQQSKTSKNQNILLWKPSMFPRDRDYLLVKYENSKFQVEAIREHPFRGELLCYADGLGLSPMGTSYMLWKPSSKQQIIIPRPHDFGPRSTAFGFCCSPTSDDYKIVARYDRNYAAYSCKNKVWTEKKEFPYETRVSTKGGVCVDGFCFWALTDLDSETLEIFYFDPRDERFNKLQKPRENIRYFVLTSLNGCLCLYQNSDCGTLGLRIWIMRDHIVNVDSNSWIELINIDKDVFHELGAPLNLITPLFFTEKNELVFRLENWESNFLGIYNSGEQKFEKIDIPISAIYIKFSEIVPCPDSLFFPAQ